MAAVSLRDVDDGVAAVPFGVVPRWDVDVQRALVGITEGIALQQGTVDDVVVEATGEGDGPGKNDEPP